MKKLFAIAFVGASLVAGATQYSCLSIITEAKKIGKWEALKSWIAAAGLTEEWSKCNYVSDDYPQFPTITNALVTSGIVTSSNVVEILKASVDAAVPDAVIMRLYQSEMSTASGRIKCHGKIVSNVIDTNTLTRTQTHADGYVYVQKFKTVNAMPIEEQLSKAERAAKREAARKARIEAEARAKAERIAELQTNMVVLATALAKQKQYPYELAEMLLQNELNKLIGTNVVDAVITPQN